MVIAKLKKVRPQMNNTIKSMEYNNYTADPPDNQEAGVPRALFIQHANSLPFEQRRVTLEQPVKIGRNVYRSAPSPTNTIFECRVLSRHHATLYYEKGHFYLVDNQSSNGTFINNSRCSISKDQEPHEVFSGDVVKFGISVVENVGNAGVTTFPPVIAMLKLYHPDGKEAKMSFNPTMTTPLHLKELYQLNNFVQEASQREQSLESRMRTLRECVERTRAAANATWELFVGEQRLLMRVRTLESMLAAGKQPETSHVKQLLDDKRNYQEVAQESLRLAHEQRLTLEESLERRSREAAALHQHNCALRLAANNALTELQKLAARCERKMCAAKLAISTAEEREAAVRAHLPITYSVQNGEAKMLVLSTDNERPTDAKKGSIEDAIRSLPDYVKLLLPSHVLNKVGLKAISAEGKTAKEFDFILKSNNIYNDQSKDKNDDECEEGGSGKEKASEAESCAEDKQTRLNHDTTVVEVESTPIDGELLSDNNANSTFADNDNRDESPNKGGMEYANILCVMSGLNDEIKALRERLNTVSDENEQLRSIRDSLLSANGERNEEEGEDASGFRATIADLQAQLTQSTVAEEANLAEIQRLSSSAAVMQAELAFRPSRTELDQIQTQLDALKQEIQEKDDLIADLQSSRQTCDKETNMQTDVDIDVGKVTAEIDDLFKLDDEDDDSSESFDTRKEYSKIDDDIAKSQLANGCLNALEEELVRAKERWAEVNDERARLAAQLASLQAKPFNIQKILALAVPILAVVAYWLLLPYIS